MMFLKSWTQRISKVSYVTWAGLVLCSILTFHVFQNNLFGFVESDHFRSFDDYSEALIVGKIAADKHDVDTENTNLGFIHRGEFAREKARTEGYEILAENSIPPDELHYYPYLSQYGLQGRVYSSLYRNLGLRLEHFEVINSLLLTLTIFALSFLYVRLFDRGYALIFLMTVISSPWIVAFARSYYWLSFTWFLPALFAAFAYCTQKKWIFYGLIYLAVLFKSLCGYEYLSTITLLACSFCLISPFFRNEEIDFSQQLRQVIIICSMCVLGFLSAFFIHAAFIGNSDIQAGLEPILQRALRRTVGDPSLAANPKIRPALEASPWSVLWTYITQWHTPSFLKLPGRLFPMMFFLSLGSLLFKLIFGLSNGKKHLALFLYSFLAPASWFILAKVHSHGHIHLNYVLWYFCFIPAMVYILSEDALALSKWLFKKHKDRKKSILLRK